VCACRTAAATKTTTMTTVEEADRRPPISVNGFRAAAADTYERLRRGGGGPATLLCIHIIKQRVCVVYIPTSSLTR